jgi:hypothetical protein
MDEDLLLKAECIVAVMGIPHALKAKPRAPSESELRQAAKLPQTLRRRVFELVGATTQGHQSGPPTLPDYRETNDAMIDGPDLDAMADTMLPIPMELQPAVSMTWTRGTEYLSTVFPRRIEQRLTGPYLHDPSEGEWAEFGWAWRIAEDPLFVIDLAGDGMLIGVEVKHLQAMYPAIYSSICNAILDALAEKAGADKEWQAPWWLQKQLCGILGISPVSSTLIADIDIAVKNSQAETKTRASALKLTNTGKTTSEKLVAEGA